jgi:hypothetical protein
MMRNNETQQLLRIVRKFIFFGVLALLVWGMMCLNQTSLAATQLISVDLQSSYGSEGRDFSGVDAEAAAASSLFGTANIWNHIGTTGFDVLTDVSGLVDSTGSPTTVGFKTSAHCAYGSASFGGTDLLNDYFYWRTWAGIWNLDWEINGLVPGGTYALFLNGSKSNASTPRQFLMKVDIDGDGDLSDQTAATVVSPPGTFFANVIAGADGKILGRGTAISTAVEPNWGGFQLAGPLVVDTDEDGVPDNLDDCSSSITTASIFIGDYDTEVSNPIDENGCTLADKISSALIAAATGAKNHGKFVSAMAHYLNGLVESGLITLEEHEAIMAGVGMADESQFVPTL